MEEYYTIEYKNNNNYIPIYKETQSGGFKNHTHHEIISLWQNPEYDNKYLNFYNLVNLFLRKKPIKIKKHYLESLNVINKDELRDFIIYYINRLSKIINNNISTNTIILFRGEHRLTFNQQIGDVLFFPTFQSASTSISTAYQFSHTSKNETQLLFVIQIPDKFRYKKIRTKLKLHDKTNKITTTLDEKEYIILPNSYYIITDKQIIYKDVHVIKMKLFFQDYHIITNNVLYKQQEIYPKNKQNFDSPVLNDFKILTHYYKRMIYLLNKLDAYSVPTQIFEILQNESHQNIFQLDLTPISSFRELITQDNLKNYAQQIANIGIGLEITNIEKYKKKLSALSKIPNYQFKTIESITLYAGFTNVDYLLKEREFISIIKKHKIINYNKIIITSLIPNEYLYDDIYHDEHPHKKIRRDDAPRSEKLYYYKYIIEINVTNTKICICKEHVYDWQNNILLIPNFDIVVKSKEHKKNKFGLPYILYKIDLSGG
ncbi:MAG: hypothetical protein Gaeavirus13_11 [Gaeavirus sp.]|uniref:Uncharacterized protein n=1 Tax=Gaeavirus sp. TaxID=2487767 RepID=A0A3G5A3X8_9VIRU|nr:MAG: hypothetical protein Gaeavirus13_11 [Gaeavirus sp.]